MHLGMYGGCRANLHQAKVTMRTVGSLPHSEEMPSEVKAQLLRRLRTMKQP